MHKGPTTADTFFHGRVIVKQPAKGYRFAVDSPILADFLPRSDAPALDIGCGVGIVSLLALYLDKFPVISGIEIQDTLYRMAVENAAANGMAERLRVMRGDFKAVFPQFKGVSTIFSNPPFFSPRQGRLSPDETIRLARVEIALTLKDLLRCAAEILAPEGGLYLIFPFARQKELLDNAVAFGLVPQRLRSVIPVAGSRPDRFLIALGKKEERLREMEPLVLFKAPGAYSAEMEQILSGRLRYE